MICKHCGHETSCVMCDHCGIDVVWYNKYGIQHDMENPGEENLYDSLSDGSNGMLTIEDFLNTVFEKETDNESN